MRAKSLQPCLTPFDPMDCSLPGSSVHGNLQTRVLEWIAISYPGDLPNPGIESVCLMSLALAGGSFTMNTPWEVNYMLTLKIVAEGWLSFSNLHKDTIWVLVGRKAMVVCMGISLVQALSQIPRMPSQDT